VLRARERAPTPYPFIVFTFKLAIESIKEFGGASSNPIVKCKKINPCGHLTTHEYTKEELKSIPTKQQNLVILNLFSHELMTFPPSSKPYPMLGHCWRN
jgi:hypothetical protein